MATALTTMNAFHDNDGAEFGPCMRALPEMQQKFVLALLEHGDANFTRAAAAAGYSQTSQGSLRVTAHRLSHDARIQAAMQEEGKRRVHSGVVLAASVLLEVANDPNAKAQDRLKAASMILNRSGIHEMTEHKMTVEHRVSDEERIKRIELQAKELGLDPAVFLRKVGIIVDAEYEEVFDPTAGLEDLL